MRGIHPDGYLKPGLKLSGAKCGIRKNSIRAKIYEIMPPGCDTYLEPFCGSGAVIIGKPKHANEYVNDINPWVINYYRCFQQDPGRLWTWIQTIWKGMCKEKFLRVRKHIRDSSGFLSHEQGFPAAAAYYVLTKTAMNGVVRVNKSGENNSTYCGTTHGRGFFDAEWFAAVHDRIKDVDFMRGDYRDFFESVPIKNPDKTFCYVDSPYAVPFTHYFQGGWGRQDHIELAKVMRKSDFYWMVSYNDHPLIRRLYKGFNIMEISTFWCVSSTPAGRGEKQELLITNYEAKL